LYSSQGKRQQKGRASRRRRRNRWDPVFSILFLVSLAVFIVAAVMIIKTQIVSMKEKEAFSDLSQAATLAQEAEQLDGVLGLVSNLPKPQQTGEAKDAEETQDEQYTGYIALYEENSDFVGWLHIDNTNIDYPVMCTPSEPEYYLRRAFDKTSSQSGTPFVGADSTIDSDLFIIYGHNMKNDTMFGTLDYYTEKDFWEETPTLLFTTLSEQREYEIFAALKTRILYQEEEGYRWYYQAGDLTEDAFDELIGYLAENALYDTGITPVYGEQIVILSTCSYETDHSRFIIAARRIDSGTE